MGVEIPPDLCNDTIMNKTTDMIPTEQQAQWNDIMGQMCVYVDDTNADVDMAYDWVCEMLNISSFVDNILHGIRSMKPGHLATIAMI